MEEAEIRCFNALSAKAVPTVQAHLIMLVTKPHLPFSPQHQAATYIPASQVEVCFQVPRLSYPLKCQLRPTFSRLWQAKALAGTSSQLNARWQQCISE